MLNMMCHGVSMLANEHSYACRPGSIWSDFTDTCQDIDLDINILTQRPNRWHNGVECHVTALTASGIIYIPNIV